MSIQKSSFIAAKELIEGGESFVISVHMRPDADAIGSALALAHGLLKIGKRVAVVAQDPVPETCAYLPDTEMVTNIAPEKSFDVGIICDADGLGRIGSAKEAISSAKSLLILDHHAWEPTEGASDGFARTVRVVDRSAAATAEVVIEVLDYLGIEIDRDMAKQLMAALVGDTGGFRFMNVTPKTLELASRLTALGALPSEAAQEIYENRSLKNAKLLGVALLNMQVSEDGKIVWTRITQEDFKKLGATDADTESIVNTVRGIKGAYAAFLFREVEPNRIQVSLRSRDGVDVNKIAKAFGGGGHVMAAGCTISSSLEEAEKALLAEVRACLES